MSSPSVVVVIVEDDHHKMLIYRYLRSRGLSSHQITTKLSPSGQGSAEQWIRTVYATEVRAYRIRHAKATSAQATGLIVMIDADIGTVQNRLKQFMHALEESGVPKVEHVERIALLVPKRNVETWILRLTDCAVNEETNYKRTRHDWHELIPRASEQLSQWTRPNTALPEDCIDSLRRDVSELNRLQF